MARCIDPQIGNLLHAYELRLLSAEERERFEIHLIACEHCSQEVESFAPALESMASDATTRAVVDEAAREVGAKAPLLSRMRAWLWPDTPLVLKPALAYLIILLMVVPAYYGLKRPKKADIRAVSQTVELIPTRSTSLKIFKKSLGEVALLAFVFEAAETGKSYRVAIESEDGNLIYDNSEFRHFDWSKTGTLPLSLSGMKLGKYHVLITDPHDSSASKRQEYYFEIEE